MRRSKKIISLFMSLIMIISVFAGVDVTAFASEAGFIINVNDDAVREGEQFTVTLSVENLTDFESCELEILFDEDCIEYRSGKNLMTDGTGVATIRKLDEGVVTVAVSFNEAVTADYQDFYEITFLSKQAGDTEILVTATSWSLYSSDAPDDFTFTIPVQEYDDSENFVIQNGVLTKYNGNQAYVTIPEKVTSIGADAFKNNDNIVRVVMTDNVTSIGNSAFYDCDNLYYCHVSDNLESIGASAFAYCDRLAGFYMPDTVTQLGGSVFRECYSLSDVSLSYGLTAIPDNAFYMCEALTSVIIPDSVTTIGKHAFDKCINLKDVTLSESLITLGARAFGETAIESIEIPKSLEDCGSASMNNYIFNDVTYSLSFGPFGFCENLKTVTFEKGTTRIADHLFAGCVGLEEIEIPDTVTIIEDYAFGDCLRLSSVKIGNAVTNIENSAFNRCVSLKEVNLPKSLTYLGSNAFRETAIESIEIPKALEDCGSNSSVSYTFNGVKYSLSYGPFALCENLKTVTFEKGATRIADHLFTGCVGLEEIVIPDTVTVVEASAFDDCLRLSSVEIGSAVTNIENSAFNQCVSLPKITIPNSVTTIGNSVFSNCTKLKDVTLSKSLKTLGYSAFRETAIESIEIPKSLADCGVADGKASYTLNGIKYFINIGPFALCENLKTVTFEKGATRIADNLFTGCVGLEEIVIPDTVTVIEASAFEDCLRLSSVKIGNAVTVIENSAFNQCVSLPKITIPDSVTTMGNYAFAESGLVNVEIPDSVTSVGTYAFYNCYSLENIKLSENVKTISSYMFRGCTSLQSITIPAAVEEIGNAAFNGCTSLESIVFSKNSELKNIYSDAFINCSALEYVILPEKTQEIGNYAFKNCVALEEVYIPQSVKTIGSEAFYGCEMLSDIEIADYSITEINKNTFMNIPALESIVLPKGLKTIGAQAFKNDTGLISVTIPESVTSIAADAFSYPEKTTIYGRTGSYAETFANQYGFKFVDNAIPAEGFALVDYDYIVLDKGQSYRAEFEFYPANSNDVVTLKSNNSRVIINGHDIKTASSAALGDSVITATTSGGLTYEFTVHIRDASKIEIVSLPVQTLYTIGEELDTTGLEVKVVYNDKSERIIDDYKVTGFDSSAEGECTVTIEWTSAYGSRYTTTFKTNIVDTRPKLTGIYLANLPAKTEYKLRESLDLTGLVVKATYTDGSEKTLPEIALEVSGFNNLKKGTQTITVRYSDFTATFNVSVGIECEHLTTEIRGYVAETCNTDGYTGDTYCTACGILLEYGDVIEATDEHDYYAEVTSASVCCDRGEMTYTCLDCGYSYIKVLELDPENHAGGTELRDAYDATCGEDGYTGNIYCLGCDALLEYGEWIPATGKHDYSTETEYVQSTCSTQGYVVMTCDCGEEETTYFDFDADNHENVVVVNAVDPTCTQDGSTQGRYCSVCDTLISGQVTIEALGHNIIITPDDEATCTQDGLTQGSYCSRCNDMDIPQEVIPAFGHNIVTVSGADPTCTELGYTEGSYCTNCSAMNVLQQIIPATGHNFATEIQRTESTCCRLGYVIMACDCGAEEKTYSELDANNHENIIVINALEPTCTDSGRTEGRYCSVCNEVIEKQEEIEALGHDWSDSHVCSRCGLTDGVIVYDTTVTLSNVTGRTGETVEVYVAFDNDTDVKTMSISDIVYDSEKLTLVSGEWLAEDAVIENWNQNDETGVITFKENKALSGNVFALTFEINEECDNSEVAIDCDFRVTAMQDNGAENQLATEVIPGSVSIADVLKGDVNGDDFVNSNDAIHLLYNTMLPDMYEVNQDCDFDGNGYVDSNDAIHLLYYTMLPDIYPLA